jgi:hypothetical protein
MKNHLNLLEKPFSVTIGVETNPNSRKDLDKVLLALWTASDCNCTKHKTGNSEYCIKGRCFRGLRKKFSSEKLARILKSLEELRYIKTDFENNTTLLVMKFSSPFR